MVFSGVRMLGKRVGLAVARRVRYWMRSSSAAFDLRVRGDHVRCDVIENAICLDRYLVSRAVAPPPMTERANV